LHDVRTLSAETRQEWVKLLSIEDMEYLLLHHEVCLQALTDGEVARIARLNMDEVAEQIRSEIAQDGLHILTKEDLTAILGGDPGETEMERRMHVDNFCAQYGFIVLHEEDMTTLTAKSVPEPNQTAVVHPHLVGHIFPPKNK